MVEVEGTPPPDTEETSPWPLSIVAYLLACNALTSCPSAVSILSSQKAVPPRPCDFAHWAFAANVAFSEVGLKDSTLGGVGGAFLTVSTREVGAWQAWLDAA